MRHGFGNVYAAVAQLVEHQLPKLRVTSSSLACRSPENQIVIAKFLSDFYFQRVLILHETVRLKSTKKSTKNFMSATINVVCYKWKTLANGESPLMVRVAKGGKRTMQSLGISINPKYWDFTRNKPKPNCPNKEYIQKIILDKQQELQQRMLELNVEQKEYTTTTLLNNENTKFELKTVSEFYHELIEQYTREDKCGNRLIYKGSFNSLKVFTNGKLDILFNDIDIAWLNKYEKWLRSKGNKETTISLLFRTLRSTYNKAIKAKCARKSDYPFDEYKINKFDTGNPV